MLPVHIQTINVTIDFCVVETGHVVLLSSYQLGIGINLKDKNNIIEFNKALFYEKTKRP